MDNNCPTTKKCNNNLLAHVFLLKRQFFNPLHLLLLILALGSALVGHYAPTITVLVSILFVCIISYARELPLNKKQQQELNKETKEHSESKQCAGAATDNVASVADKPQNNDLLTDVEPACSLLDNIDQLSEYLVAIYCSIIAIVTIVGIVQQRPPSELAQYALSLAVLAIPEGLPALVAGSNTAGCDNTGDDISDDDSNSNNSSGSKSGQYVYLRIHNFLVYQLSISLASMALIAIAFANRTEPPLNVYHLLYVNLLADGPPGQSLGCEEPSDEELSLWPRTVHDPLISWRLIVRTLSLTSTLIALNGGLYNYLLDSSGHLDGRARALLFSCFVFCIAFGALSLRSKFKTIFESRIYANLQLLFSCTTLVLVQICLTQIDALNELLQTEPISPLELLYVFLYASLVLLIMDSLKLLGRLLYRGRFLFVKLAQRLQVPSAPFADSFYSTSSLAKANRFTNDAHDDNNSSKGSGSSSSNNNSSGIGSSLGSSCSRGHKFNCLAAGQGAPDLSPQCTAIKPLASVTHNGSAHF